MTMMTVPIMNVTHTIIDKVQKLDLYTDFALTLLCLGPVVEPYYQNCAMYVGYGRTKIFGKLFLIRGNVSQHRIALLILGKMFTIQT